MKLQLFPSSEQSADPLCDQQNRLRRSVRLQTRIAAICFVLGEVFSLSIQLLIILLYFAATVAIGLISAKKSQTSHAFVGVGLSGLSIVCASAGEWLGGTATTGVSEYGFSYGLSGAWYTIANGVGTMFLALFFARLYRSMDTVTVPGIIQRFFGQRARTVSSILLIFVMLAVGLSQMIAAGKLGESLLGLDFNTTCIVFACIFIIYTLAGGMNAVASTNIMHLLVMYGGIVLALILSLHHLGGWQSFVRGIAEAEAVEPGKSYFNMFSIGLPKVLSWIIASVLGACTAQAGIQPILAAKDVPTAKRACVITAFVVAPFGFITALLGMCAKVLSLRGLLLNTDGVNVCDAKSALFTLMMNLPGWAGGLILASLLAAVLSTVSPIILSSGTMFVRDLYPQISENPSERKMLLAGRLATALSGVICCIAAILLVNAGTVLDLVYAAYSLRGALFIIVLFGIYTNFVSEKAACRSMICTGVAATGWVAAKLIFGSYPIAPWITETYVSLAAAVVTTLLFSLIYRPSAMEMAQKKKTKLDLRSF